MGPRLSKKIAPTGFQALCLTGRSFPDAFSLLRTHSSDTPGTIGEIEEEEGGMRGLRKGMIRRVEQTRCLVRQVSEEVGWL